MNGVDTLEEKQLDAKVSMEVMVVVNIMQTKIEYLTLLLQWLSLSLGIPSLTKEIVTLSLISLVMQKTRFILLRKCNRKMANNIKVIPSEECLPQHTLLWTTTENTKTSPKPFSPKLCYCRIKEQTVQKELELVFTSKLNAFNTAGASMEEIWRQLYLIPLMKHVVKQRNIFWWNGEVNLAIVEKGWCWKVWKQGVSKEQYLQAKWNRKHTVYTTKRTAGLKKFSDLKPGMNDSSKFQNNWEVTTKMWLVTNVSKVTQVIYWQ